MQAIKRCFDADSVLYTSHARREMKQEPFGEICEEEVYEAICTSEVVEEYPDDTPYPSALLLGMTRTNRPLHIVCAYDAEGKQAIIITVYHPDPQRWDYYRRRKK
jgi:hypothetical protein